MKKDDQTTLKNGKEFVDQLLGLMDIEEKVAQLGSVWSYELLDQKHFSPEKARRLISKGIGQITRPASTTGLSPREVAEFTNSVQEFLIKNTRLGIPAIIHEECLAGYPGIGGICFPQPIGLASSWDPQLVRRIAAVIREQLRSVGIRQGLAPVLDLARDARWGRVEETFGEDPLVAAAMGVAYISGLQGEDPKTGVIATAKHFIGYGAPEGGLNCAPAHVGKRELLETFALPFESAVRVAKVQSVMPSYNEIDGIPCTINRELISTLLRKQWGFEGTVVSDYRAIDLVRTYHKSAASKEDASYYAITAGLDVELPQTDCYGKPLLQLVRTGVLPEIIIDNAVRRVLLVKYMLGLFDEPYVDINKAEYWFISKEARDLALEAALESIVLLKNDGILPIRKQVQRIALVGPCAFDRRCLLGDYSGIAIAERMCLMSDKFEGVKQTINSEIQKIPTIAEVIKEKLNTEIIEAESVNHLEQITSNVDAAIVVLGDKSGFTPECTCGETRDSATLRLPHRQEDLILRVCEKDVPVIVVLITGRPYNVSNIVDKVNAIIQCWKPGERGAEAIVQVLMGKYNPRGKLPMTFPRSVGQIPNFYYQKPSAGRSYWWEKYVDEDVNPQFCFGHGLSYTAFEYSDINVHSKVIHPKGSIHITLYVSNVGTCEGVEVVQIYVQGKGMYVTRPKMELKGFIPVKLKPGETKKVEWSLPCRTLAFYDEHGNLVIKPGQYSIMIGSSVQDIKYSTSVQLNGYEKIASKALDNVKQHCVE